MLSLVIAVVLGLLQNVTRQIALKSREQSNHARACRECIVKRDMHHNPAEPAH